MTDDRGALRHRASAARTAATSPSGCSPRASRCTPSPTTLEPLPDLPGRRPPPRRPDRASTRSARCCSTWRPTRSTTWPRSARSRGRGRSPTSPPGSTAMAAAALMESALLVQEKHGRPVRFVQASSAEIFGEPERTPAGRVDAAAPGEPVRRRQGLRAPDGRRLPPPRPARGQRDPLQPRVARAGPTQFVTRKITSTVAAIARGRADRLTLGNLDARRDWGWAPDYVDAMVRAARADEPRDYVVATGVGALGARLRGARPSRRAGIDDWAAPGRRSTRSSSGRPTRPSSPATPAGRATSSAGRRPSDFDELVGRMVDADLAAAVSVVEQVRAGSRRTRS